MKISKKTLFGLSIFLIIIFSTCFVSAHENTTDTDVYETNDVDDDLISQESENTIASGNHDFSDMQKDIDNAKAGDTVKIEGTYSGKNTITVTKNLTIEGVNGGATFDGSKLTSEDGIFSIYDNEEYESEIIEDEYEYQPSTMTVTLKNLKFVNCKNGYSAIYVGEIQDINIINCTFINCKSNKNIDDWLRGGALEIGTYNKTTITGCKFINCSSESGGAIYLYSEYIIDSCEFINCYADYHGGAVYVSGIGKIVNSNFTKNNAKNGGAIAGEINSLEIDNCNFNNNHAKDYGGAIHLYAYDSEDTSNTNQYHLKLSNSSFSNNKEDQQTIDGGLISNFNCYSSNDLFIYSSETPRYSIENCKNLNANSLKKATLNVAIKPIKLTTTYDSGKSFKITATSNKKPVSGVKLAIKVYTGKKSKTYYATTNSKGVANFKHASTLKIGSHKVEISSANKKIIISKKTSTIKVKKAKTIVKAPKVTAKAKKNKYFKITVKNKATKKVVKKLKIKVKVYTGKKAKKYTLKTNKKGVAKIKTKSLKKGSHKVVISSGNSKYKVSLKSKIVIK